MVYLLEIRTRFGKRGKKRKKQRSPAFSPFSNNIFESLRAEDSGLAVKDQNETPAVALHVSQFFSYFTVRHTRLRFANGQNFIHFKSDNFCKNQLKYDHFFS